MEFNTDDTFRISRGFGKTVKAHVLAVVDDCQVVIKWFGNHKQWWHYEVIHKSILELEIERAKEA